MMDFTSKIHAKDELNAEDYTSKQTEKQKEHNSEMCWWEKEENFIVELQLCKKINLTWKDVTFECFYKTNKPL